jgi:ABC-type uncharacterized transport system involved in gliding motility auxiliary subunit
MSNKLLTGGGLLVALVLVLAVNMLGSLTFSSVRLDLTERKAYTLSDGTRNILEALDEPITLRLFLSEKVATRTPSVATYANRVRDMLYEFQRRSDDKLILKIIDPEPFSEEEDRAVGFGLHGIPLDAEGTNFYFGLVGANSTDDEVVVPYLSMEREEFLEYDLAKVIWQLSDIDQKVVGLLSSIPINGMDPRQAMAMRQQPPPPWVVMDQVNQLFEVQTLEATLSRVPDSVDVLMVVHPKNLPAAALYAIDQYVMGGGRAVFFLDPHAESDVPNPMMAPPRNASKASSLGALPAAWGFEVESGKFVGDMQHAIPVRFNYRGQMVSIDYPAWIDLPGERFAAKETITAELGKLVFGTAGHIRDTGVDGVTLTPLVQSSSQSMLIGVERLNPNQDPRAVVRDFVPSGKPFTLAARISGKLNSAFPDGLSPTKEGAVSSATQTAPEANAQHLAESKDAVNLVVIADVDFMEDRFWVQVQDLLGTRMAMPSAGNGSFVVNTLDSLTGSNDLISVRSRGRFRRPFQKVEDIRRDAELRFREKEQQLTEQLNQTEAKLVELSRGNQAGDGLVLSAEQQTEIERFRSEKVQIRKELRDVLHQRRKDLNDLEFNLRLINIALVPFLVVIAGGLVGAWQVQRRRRPSNNSAAA